MKIRIILVEPEHDINVGMICRSIKNFKQSDLYLVNPKAKLKFDAIKYSKHAVDILKKAKKVKNLKNAIKGCDYVIGTTGILVRFKDTYRNPIDIKKAKLKIKKTNIKKLAIVFGRESIGLNLDELNLCDLLVNINTNPEYPVLNLSHSVSIFLYVFSNLKKQEYEQAQIGQIKTINKYFFDLVDFYSHLFKKPKKIKISFKRVIGRAIPQKSEADCIISVLKKVVFDIDKKNSIDKKNDMDKKKLKNKKSKTNKESKNIN